MHTSISDTEIRVEITSNRTRAGKTTVAVAVANALKAAFPATKVIVEDPEGCFLARQESMAQTDSGCTLRAPSIRIVDNPRLLQGPPLLGHQTITIDYVPLDAVSLLMLAYAKREIDNGMGWNDVDRAFEQAHIERPGAYDAILNKLKAAVKEDAKFEAIDEEHGLFRLFTPDALQPLIDYVWDTHRRGLPGPELLKVDAEDILIPEVFNECSLHFSKEQRDDVAGFKQRVMVLTHF